MGQNVQFIDVPSQKPPPEDITIFPFDPMSEGENSSDVGEQPPRKMRERKNVDYRLLNDPFPDEEQNENQIIKEAENAYQIQTETPLGGNDPLTLEEAQKSPKWPEWNKAIKIELEQLQQTGTWKLVDCPKDAVPISNKWVFVTKYNKEGELQKYKARLVAKGCAQRPGYDYMDTYSPVVRLESI
jgi:hypothetical protein